MKSRAALTASAIKKELKQLFPGVAFSVRSHNYSSVRITWKDFVSADKITSVVSKYEMGHFDGMTDSYEYTNRRDDIPQVQYVFPEQSISPEYARVLLGLLKDTKMQGIPDTLEIKEKTWRDGTISWELSECSNSMDVYRMMRKIASYCTYINGVLTKDTQEQKG